jgi:hypothetical protein
MAYPMQKKVFSDSFGFGADTTDRIIVPANYVFMGRQRLGQDCQSLCVP